MIIYYIIKNKNKINLNKETFIYPYYFIQLISQTSKSNTTSRTFYILTKINHKNINKLTILFKACLLILRKWEITAFKHIRLLIILDSLNSFNKKIFFTGKILFMQPENSL